MREIKTKIKQLHIPHYVQYMSLVRRHQLHKPLDFALTLTSPTDWLSPGRRVQLWSISCLPSPSLVLACGMRATRDNSCCCGSSVIHVSRDVGVTSSGSSCNRHTAATQFTHVHVNILETKQSSMTNNEIVWYNLFPVHFIFLLQVIMHSTCTVYEYIAPCMTTDSDVLCWFI